MKVYTFHLFNRHGSQVGERYVVASGVNAAKRALKESDYIWKGLTGSKKLKCVDCNRVLIVND